MLVCVCSCLGYFWLVFVCLTLCEAAGTVGCFIAFLQMHWCLLHLLLILLYCCHTNVLVLIVNECLLEAEIIFLRFLCCALKSYCISLASQPIHTVTTTDKHLFRYVIYQVYSYLLHFITWELQELWLASLGNLCFVLSTSFSCQKTLGKLKKASIVFWVTHI